MALHHARVLIVDDNADDVYLIKQAIQAANPESVVTHVSDADEALRLLGDSASSSYDLVVLDWRLPRHSGDEIVEPLLASNLAGGRRLVVLTSAIPPRVQSSLAGMGVMVMIKPLDLTGYAELGRQLNSLLLNKRSQPA